MRIHVWHGYLLSGTGSNEYTRLLARTLANQGHDVTVFCQDPNPGAYDLGGATVVVPQLPGPLPVFVLDHYENADAQLLPEMDRKTVEEFVAANAAAIAEVGPADLLIANHLLLGGPVGAATGLPFVVKAHGSELEFAMRGRTDLCDWAFTVLQSAIAVIVGSRHVGRVVADLVGVPPTRIRQIPPGVDTSQMMPLSRDKALAGLLFECAQDLPNPPSSMNERLPDDGNEQRMADFFSSLGYHGEGHGGAGSTAGSAPVVSYVGKLSNEKGVDLLLHATKDLGLATVVVGFGPQRAELENIAGERTLFTGPLQHRHLAKLWPLMACSVVPSVFPEAFGMVAAEAASCGCPPLVAYHSGLAEIADGLAEHYPESDRDLVSFPTGDLQVLTRKLLQLSQASYETHAAMSRGARQAALELWSWGSVAADIVALAP